MPNWALVSHNKKETFRSGHDRSYMKESQQAVENLFLAAAWSGLSPVRSTVERRRYLAN